VHGPVDRDTLLRRPEQTKTETRPNHAVLQVRHRAPARRRFPRVGSNGQHPRAHNEVQTALYGLVSIALTPVNPSVQAGNTQQFHATGTFTGGRKQDVTRLATWTSSLATVATSNAAGTQGLATANPK
jgi:Bacterial Ig-like domain (group 2)